MPNFIDITDRTRLNELLFTLHAETPAKLGKTQGTKHD